MRSITSAVCALGLVYPAKADIRLPAVLGDHMVLQQSTEARLWGWAKPGETVLVSASWTATPVHVVADEKGVWRTTIRTPAADNKPHMISFKGENEVVLNDVLIGEVWVCSGQSNMEWPFRASENWQEAIKGTDQPRIRLFTVQNTVSAEAMEDCKGSWAAATPETVKSFSAVGYYFAEHVRRSVDVPIGVISSDWGGTPAEAWTSEATLRTMPEWMEGLNAVAKLRGDAAAREPGPARGMTSQMPTSLYNGMIAPLTPLSIRGVIWYQGESNRDRAFQYRTLFPAMIRDWRTRWAMPDNKEFPFYFVQIAPYRYNGDKGEAAELREAQLLASALPHTGMAVTMDIGDPADIHPVKKKEVGERLARWALAKTCGKMVECSGPTMRSLTISGDKIIIAFDHATGLNTGGNPTTPVSHFTIAGEDQKFIPAVAEIDGETVIVSAEGVKAPVAVRYAWGAADEPNLKNGAGLPATSFRTDDWPGVTQRPR